jgi:mono/diheme cytochrome c family protein
MLLKNTVKTAVFMLGAAAIVSCTQAGKDDPGTEYAPNMYHSVAYEPLKQVKDKEAGKWVNSIDSEVGEYYTSNPNNPHEMNMRLPVEGTVRRNGELPYRYAADELELAAEEVKNPLPDTKEVLKDGEELYKRFCQHCHGETGQGDGAVGKILLGVPSYSKGRVKSVSEGHIFHVITHGKGRMGAHASQIDIEERWKIVRYVQQLQNQ